jgi:hypothetical protein
MTNVPTYRRIPVLLVEIKEIQGREGESERATKSERVGGRVRKSEG